MIPLNEVLYNNTAVSCWGFLGRVVIEGVISDGSIVADEEQCQLVCKSVIGGHPHYVRSQVIDGTKCRGFQGVCLDGRCVVSHTAPYNSWTDIQYIDWLLNSIPLHHIVSFRRWVVMVWLDLLCLRMVAIDAYKSTMLQLYVDTLWGKHTSRAHRKVICNLTLKHPLTILHMCRLHHSACSDHTPSQG